MVVAIGVRPVLLGKSCGPCNTVLLRGYQPGSRGSEKKTNHNGGGLSYHLAFCGLYRAFEADTDFCRDAGWIS